MNSRFEFSQGDVICGKYVIETPLGISPSALTFLANENQSHEKICLKIYRPEIVESLFSNPDFLSQAKLLPALIHDNLALVYEVQESHGLVIVAREMLEGPDFGAFAVAFSENRLTRGLELIWQASQSLVYLHDKAFHLNLHPGNMILTGFTAKIVDPDPRLFSGMEGPHLPMPLRPEYLGYAPPEARNAMHIPYPSSDLYSLGGLFFLLVTGKHPSENPEENHRQLSSLNREVGDFLVKAIHPDPEKRFTGAEEFSDVLWSLQAILQQMRPNPPSPASTQTAVERKPVQDFGSKGRTEIFPGPVKMGSTLFGQVAPASFADEEPAAPPAKPVPAPPRSPALRKPLSSLEMPPPRPAVPKPKTTLASLEQDSADLTLSGGNTEGLSQYGFKGANENMTLAIQRDKQQNFRKTLKLSLIVLAAAIVFFGGLFFLLKALGRKPDIETAPPPTEAIAVPVSPKPEPVIEEPIQKQEAPPVEKPANAADPLKSADVLNDAGRIADANKAYAEALKISGISRTEELHALGGLAATFEKMNMKNEALEAAEKLLGLQPGNRFAQKLKERMR